MKPNASKPREDVLNAFAVEPDPSADTLDRYVREYPEYAVDPSQAHQKCVKPS